MDARNTNSCKILLTREIQKYPVSCAQLITDKFNRKTELLFKRDLVAHYGCVNAVEFSNDGQYLVSGGDDRRVLLWNVQKALYNCGKPSVMCSQHNSNIFCLAFDNSLTIIYSAGNDDQVILHDIRTGSVLDVFNLGSAVYRVSIDPCNDNIFAGAVENGYVLIFDTRIKPSCDPYELASSKSSFHSVEFNPIDPRLISTGNSKEGTALWDIRMPEKRLMQYGPEKNCMNVRWDQTGTKLLALRRRRMPVLYDIKEGEPTAYFYHDKYWNSCTMKSCCFAGLKDEYILSGSDDFNLYMWKISDGWKSETKINNVHSIMRGHRSIVNHVRFDPHNCIIASSGVEKMIKVWSPLSLPYSSREIGNTARRRYTREEYLLLMNRSGQLMTHDYSEQSTTEDPQMMAFFDTLVRREQESSSNSDDDSDSDVVPEENLYYDHSLEEPVDTDYSSLSDDSPEHSSRIDVETNSRNHNENSCSHSAENRNASENSSSDGDEESNRTPKPSLPITNESRRRPINMYYDDSSNEDEPPSSRVFVLDSLVPVSATTTSCSTDEDDATSGERSSRKRKLKCKVKDALQRLKRVRSGNNQSSSSSSAIDTTSDRGSSGTSELCSSSGGTSTDTVDSGYIESLLSAPKYKFSSLKRNENRKYRSQRRSTSTTSSDSD